MPKIKTPSVFPIEQTSSTLSDESTALMQAYKQFSLETDRLERAYQSLKDQFHSTQLTLQETHTRLYGKLAELDFVSRYLDAILNHMSQGLLFIDSKGMVTTYNATAATILGKEQSQVLFYPIWDVFSDQAFGFSIKEALQTKLCPKRGEVTWKRADEKPLDLEIEGTFVFASPSLNSSVAFPSSALTIQGLLILIRNITEIHQLQGLADRHNRLMDLGEMAARMAHEIRNPLGGIKGFATLLQQDLKDQPELQKMATAIVEGTEGLSRFVSNVLNYTHPFQPHFESVDLVSFLAETLQLVQADQALNEGITCNFKTNVESLIVNIDPQLFRSAILNLLVNGLQAMPKGGHLLVELSQIKEQIVMTITDTGCGISDENLDKIFSPFFTTKEGGNGLGLSEVFKVIQAHQGWIEVQSKVGEGTTFTIQIPLNMTSVRTT